MLPRITLSIICLKRDPGATLFFSMNLDSDFSGRRAILDLLKKRVLDLKDGYRQNVALLGGRHVGKTAILRHFLFNLDEENVTPVYLDLENKDFPFILRKFIGSLLYNYSKNKQLPLHQDVPLLIETTKKLIPHTVQVIGEIYKNFQSRKLTTCFLGLLALPEIFTNETGHACVLVLDEFQGLEALAIPNAFQHLGKKIMTQKKCLYIVSSSYPRAAEEIFSEKLSLLFGNFEILHVDAFDLEMSRQFIHAKLRNIRMGEALRHFLIDFTAGYPLYLSLLCEELAILSAVHKQDEIFVPVLTQAVENTLFHPWGVIGRHFELIVSELSLAKGRRLMQSLLISLANDKYRIAEICDDLGLAKNHVTPKLNRLVEEGIILKNGNYHYFKDKLFRYWIKYVFQQRLRSLEIDPGSQGRQFKEEFNRLVESFKVSSRKDVSSRIVELLNCFDNEAFNLNGRRYKLPIFREIVPLKFKNEQGNYFDVIRASTADNSWFIVLKDENFGEAEGNTVLAETRKTGHKPERCLIISLKDLDENMRLKALQERFWIWSEKEINTLLTLFNKPYII